MVTREKQHRGRGLLGLFSCCFQGNDQPEITHCHDNINSVVSLEPPLPLPPPQELDIMFTELVVSTRHKPPPRWLLLGLLESYLCHVPG